MTVIYCHLERIIDIGDMKRLANYILAGAFRTNEGSEKVMDAMPAGREATAALFLECLLEIVNKRNPSAPIGEMIYKAMMKFIPDTADDCKSVLFEADKKSRSPATHHEHNNKDDEDATPLSGIPSKLPRYKHDVLLLLQAHNEHAQLHSKQQQKSNVVIQRLLSHGLNLRDVYLSHSQCQAVGNVLQTHGQHCGPVVSLLDCQVGNVGLQLLANGLQQYENTTYLGLEYNDITDCTVVRCVIEKLLSKLEVLGLDGNAFGDSGARCLADTLYKCQCEHLKFIDLSHTNVKSEALPVLAAILQSCRKLTRVDVWALRTTLAE